MNPHCQINLGETPERDKSRKVKTTRKRKTVIPPRTPSPDAVNLRGDRSRGLHPLP